MLKNLTIKTRLVFVLCFLAVQLLLGAGMGLYALKQSNSQMHAAISEGVGAVGDLDVVARKLIRIQADLSYATTAEPAQSQKYVEGIPGHMAEMNKAWDHYMASPMAESEKSQAQAFAAARAKFEKDGIEPTVSLLKQGDTVGALKVLHEKMIPHYAEVKDQTDALIQTQMTDAEKLDSEAKQRYETVQLICVIGLSVGLLMALGMGIWLVRSIVTPLNEAITAANKVAAGDLTVHISATSNDETGKLLTAMQSMTDSLVRIVSDVRGGTELLSTAAAEIASGNQDLSSRTEQQAGALEETASSMEELTSTVKQNADNAEQANRLATAASETARQGGQAVAEVVRTMEQINKSAHEIANITSVIDSIAFQTNLLALNAAVEAARAGDAGRGFAVVATEVRALAKRSADAAREIKGLITTSTTQVEDGTRQVTKAGQTMTDIVRSITQVNDIVSEISAASYEQSSGIEMVNKAIVDMDLVTQQNAALVEEAAAGAASMQDEAQRLTQAVAVFKLA